MSSNQEYTIQLKERQYAFLTEMVNKFSLPDESKALRCLINYAVAQPDLQESIFAEIRCQDC